MTDMTVTDVARACGVTERTVRRWLREGRLPGLRVGGRVRIPERAVRELSAPYGQAAGADTGAAAGFGWLASLRDPDRLATLDVRRAERAIALMDLVRGMATPVHGGADAVGLVREGRHEQDRRWDERPA
ncbi:MAG: helix-turn-helix domain-containing protein [Chloroflexota bacterium]